jgi:hypothetical protein
LLAANFLEQSLTRLDHFAAGLLQGKIDSLFGRLQPRELLIKAVNFINQLLAQARAAAPIEEVFGPAAIAFMRL